MSVTIKVLSMWCNTPLPTFSTAQNSFWTDWFWRLLVLPPFVFHLFHIGKMFPFGDFFHLGKQNKSGRYQVNREGGAWGHAVFGQKLLNIQCGVGRCTHKSPKKWANVLKESSEKKSLKQNAASHNKARWYTDRDGFLVHLAGEAYTTMGLPSRR